MWRPCFASLGQECNTRHQSLDDCIPFEQCVVSFGQHSFDFFRVSLFHFSKQGWPHVFIVQFFLYTLVIHRIFLRSSTPTSGWSNKIVLWGWARRCCHGLVTHGGGFCFNSESELNCDFLAQVGKSVASTRAQHMFLGKLGIRNFTPGVHGKPHILTT